MSVDFEAARRKADQIYGGKSRKTLDFAAAREKAEALYGGEKPMPTGSAASGVGTAGPALAARRAQARETGKDWKQARTDGGLSPEGALADRREQLRQAEQAKGAAQRARDYAGAKAAEEEIKALEESIRQTQARLDQGKKAREEIQAQAEKEWRQAETEANWAQYRPLEEQERALQTELARLRRERGDTRAVREELKQVQDQLRRMGPKDPATGLGWGLKSIGDTFIAAPDVIGETVSQAWRNHQADQANPAYQAQLQAVRQAEEALSQAMEAARRNPDNYGMPEADSAVIAAREALRQEEQKLKALSDQTPVSLEGRGMRRMAESQADAQKAVAGQTGAKRWTGEQMISVGQNAALLPTGFIHPALPLAAMGSVAGAQKAYELSQRGIGAGEALERGVASGLIEAATELVPLESVLDMIKTGGKGALRNFLKQMGVEATEEGLSYAANYIADRAAADPEASFDVGELLESMAGGGFSGGIFAGMGTGIHALGQTGTKRINGATVDQARTAQQKTASQGETVKADTTLFDRGILKNLNQARKTFLDFAHRNFPATVVNTETGKTIKISRNGLDKFLSGRLPYEKYATGFHIPELMEHAHKVGEAADQKGRIEVLGYEYYDSPITVDGAEYVAHIRVRNTRSGDSYYGHTISEIEDIRIEPSARAATTEVPQPVNALDGSISDSTIPQSGEGVKGKYAQGQEVLVRAAQELVEEYGKSLGKAGETVLGQMYDPAQPAAEYAQAMTALYNAGRKGTDLAEAHRRAGRGLNAAQAQAAYLAGQADRSTALRAEGAGETGAGLVVDSYVEQSLDYETARQINGVAKALGTRVRFVDQVAGGGANAQIQGTEIQIERNNPNPVRALLGHEWTHRVQAQAEKQYLAFREAVARMEDTQAKVEAMRELYRQNGIELDEAAALDEVAADYAGRLLEDGTLLEEFIRRNGRERTLLERLRDALRSIAKRLTGHWRSTAQEAVDKLNAALDAAAKRAQETKSQETHGEATRYSINETFSQDVQAWVNAGQQRGERFVLGSTGPVLQGLGAIESDIFMEGDKISAILEQHPEMTIREIQHIPDILEDPVLVIKSHGSNRRGQNTRLVMFGSLKAQNGQPVLSVLDLRPVEGKLVITDMQKVNSSYTRNNALNYVQGGEILHADKMRTVPLLRSIGLHGPIELQKSGSLGSISYVGRSVNVEGVPFSDVVRTPAGGEVNGRNSLEGGEEAARYSLKAFEDGRRFVEVDTDQARFDGLSEKEMGKLATQIIRERFVGRVIGLDNPAFVNGESAREYAYPAKSITGDIRKAKMRASTELDNLLDAGTNFRTAPDGKDGHVHPEAVGGFSYFDTIFKVGEQYYSGVVNIKNTKSGRLLKDITKIENITQDISSSYGDKPLATFLRDVSMDSISGAGEEVNGRNSLKGSAAVDAAARVEYLQKSGEDDTIGARKDSLKGDMSRDRRGETGTARTQRQEQGIDTSRGEAVRGAAEKAVRDRTVFGRSGGIDPAFGEKPVRTWAEGHIVEPYAGSITHEERQTAVEYGVASFVVSDTVWEKYKGGVPAFSAGGQVFFRETLPEGKAGMLAPHELTHVMRQKGYQPYLDFLERTPMMLDMSAKATKVLMNHVAEHKHSDITRLAPERLYDELAATIYGHYTAGKMEGLTEYLQVAFHDFDAYIKELSEIHAQFKRENGGEVNGRNSLKGSAAVMEETERITARAKEEGWSEARRQEEQRRAVERIYQEMVETYGAMPAGEKAAREVPVPRRSSGTKRVSQTVRTVLEAGATPEAAIPQIQELVAKGTFSYEAATDQKALAAAEATIQHKGWSRSMADWLTAVRAGAVSKEHTTLGWALYDQAAAAGDLAAAMDILQEMVKSQRSAAQALQATRILKQMSPEAQLYGVRQSVENLQEELNARYGGKDTPELVIDRELAQRFMEAETQAERDEAIKEIYRDIGRQMPARMVDKWNAWRYLAMLGNPRTHVRNIVGNAGFAPVVAVKDLTATAIERAVDALSGGKLERSKGAVGLGKKGRALLAAAWADYVNAEEAALGGGKYGDLQSANRYVEEGRIIFSSKPGRALEAARRANSKALDAEDVWFSRPHYAYAMAQYCAAHKITAEEIRAGDRAVLNRARNYAVKEAQKATYRDTNILSQTVSSLGRGVRSRGDSARNGLGLLVEGILPFRKTPANILARGLEYSPLGLVKSLSRDLYQVQRGKMTGAECIDHISAGLTGTGLLALGAYLAAQGLVRGRGTGDDRERELEELQGHQDYALELPDGTSVTLDWLAPEALPFFVGVNLWETAQRDRGESLTLAGWLAAVGNISEPLLEMSCLQSLNDALNVGKRASSEGLGLLPSFLAGAATNYLTQVLPTAFGQLERTREDRRETTYVSRDAFLTQEMQYALGKMSGKIPGWEFQQIPYIDAWGRTEATGSLGARAFHNLLDPAYLSQTGTSPAEEELLRLYRATGEGSVLPQRAGKYFTANGTRRDLTAEEYVAYAQAKGQTSLRLVTALVESKGYGDLEDGERAEAVADAYQYAEQTARMEVEGEYAPDSWVGKAREAEKRYGIPVEAYIVLRQSVAALESLRDGDGEAIPNSRGLRVMEEVYAWPGLTDKQRRALFAYFGVGKKIIGWNRTLVREKLREMERQAG